MAKIQLVIEIEERLYKNIIDNDKDDEEFEAMDVAFYHAKPLPKGHGRLIDADSIYQIVKPIEQSDADWGMTAETAKRIIHDVFNKAPTIIEADKEDKDE